MARDPSPKTDRVDPERDHADAAFNHADDRQYSGEDYRLDDERAQGAAMPAGQVPPPGTLEHGAAGTGRDDPNMPAGNGRIAQVDPLTGEVHGSGMGAGGGQPGEDMEQDTPGGDGPVRTGVGSRD